MGTRAAMICISIAPQSHRLGMADIVNAAPQCDLVEVRLDTLVRTPEVGLFLENRQKPVLISCPRLQDGGVWQRTEEQRLTILRQAIVGGADYVQLELDIADQVPRYGKTKRVISCTAREPVRGGLDAVYQRACSLDADVVKLTAPTATLEEAWPLLQLMAKPAVPIVAVGVGEPGLTLSLLGRKLGSPWIYAALEKGMEAHPGQATVRELEEIYRWRDINRRTRLVGVAGFTEQQRLTVQLMNEVFAELDLNTRCLPMEVGDLSHFKRMMRSLRVSACVVNEAYWASLFPVVDESEEAARLSRHTDLVVKQKNEGWYGYSSLWRAAILALEGTLQSKDQRADTGPAERTIEGGKAPVGDQNPQPAAPNPKPLQGRTVLVAGASSAARALCYGIKRRGGLLAVTGPDSDRAKLVAQMFQARYVPLQRSYDTMYDVLLMAPPEKDAKGNRRENFDLAYLRASSVILD
ncbi:MAG: type I 3-dehydroquinate dehydratase, partial [Pirellulales bacterium]